MSQELFVSVNELVEMAAAKGTDYDHIVIESSGISEPKSVRSVFQDAESYEMKLMDEVGPALRSFFSIGFSSAELCLFGWFLGLFFFVLS